MQTTKNEAFIHLLECLPANTGNWEGWSSERPGLHDDIKNTEPRFVEQNGPHVPKESPSFCGPRGETGKTSCVGLNCLRVLTPAALHLPRQHPAHTSLRTAKAGPGLGLRTREARSPDL